MPDLEDPRPPARTLRLYRFVGAHHAELADGGGADVGAWGEHVHTPSTAPSPVAAGHHGPGFAAVDSWTFATVADALRWRDASGPTTDPGAWLLTREWVMVNGAPTGPEDAVRGVKLTIGMSRRPEVPVDDFHRHWVQEHASFSMAMPGVSRYTICTTLTEEYARGVPRYDGVAEHWWRTEEDLEQYFASPLLEDLRADMAPYVDDHSAFFSVFCRDGEVVRRTGAPVAQAGIR